MASCSYCNGIILFGGRRYGEDRFCNERCANAGIAIAKSRSLSPAVITEFIQRVWHSPCPKCNGPGPVDVHTSHTVFSALIVTSWRSSPEVSCKSCGTKRQAKAAAFSLVAGWWGFPWGLIVTPIQVSRNVIGMLGGPGRDQPSPKLEKIARLTLGSRI